MRILLVNYRYFISGGPEKYMFNIKKLLEENGHEVIPFSVHSNKNVPTDYSKYFVEPIGGRDATYFDEVKKTPKSILQMISRSIYSFEVKRAIQHEIEDVKPDLVYIIHFVNKLSPSIITGAKQKGVPVVLRLSDYFLLCPRFNFLYNKSVCEDCLKHGYTNCVKKRCVKNSLAASLIRVVSMKIHAFLKIYDQVDAFITPSNFLKAKLVENGYDRNKIFCVPTFTSSESSINEPIIGEYGLYFGRIDEEKGVETVVLAYEKMPQHRVVIMGNKETEEAKRLINYVKNYHLENIEFIGHQSGKELEQIIKSAKYVIIPSIWYDNLPNTALESFQYSKPVLASNIGSLPELVIDGYNGFLFKPGDVEDLILKVEKLDNNEQLISSMGKNSRTMLEKNFSPETHYEILMKVFNAAVGN